MKARLVFVPPGGGEAEYTLDFDLPSVPQVGDYVSVTRPGEDGTADFIVRRAWWALNYPSVGVAHGGGVLHSVIVECEFAHGPRPSAAHQRTCELYASRGLAPKVFDTPGG